MYTPLPDLRVLYEREECLLREAEHHRLVKASRPASGKARSRIKRGLLAVLVTIFG